MAVSTFAPLSVSQLAAIAATAFNSQPGVIAANTDPGSALGPVFSSAALIAAYLQNELSYTNGILRLGAIPALRSGAPNPDVDAYCEPFGVFRLGADYATGLVTCYTSSPVTMGQVVVPVGAIFATQGSATQTAGVQFMVIADAGNLNYNAGLNGYPIPSPAGGDNSNSQTTVTVQCLSAGIIGNALANTITQIYGSITTPFPASVTRITNASALASGVNVESDQAYKNRFTIEVSSGRVGTQNAIIAAYLKQQTGLIYSYGDRVNADGTEHDAYFTFVANIANTGTAPSSPFLTASRAAIEAVRSGGVSYQVIAPSIIHVNGVGTIYPTQQFLGQTAAVQAAVNAAYTAFCNGIGLNVDTTPTLCSLFRCGAALLSTQINGVNCVSDITGLTLNGVSGDLTAPFASQFAAGTHNFTISS